MNKKLKNLLLNFVKFEDLYSEKNIKEVFLQSFKNFNILTKVS